MLSHQSTEKGDPNTLAEGIERYGEDDMQMLTGKIGKSIPKPQTLNLFYLPMFDSNSYKKEILP